VQFNTTVKPMFCLMLLPDKKTCVECNCFYKLFHFFIHFHTHFSPGEGHGGSSLRTRNAQQSTAISKSSAGSIPISYRLEMESLHLVLAPSPVCFPKCVASRTSSIFHGTLWLNQDLVISRSVYDSTNQLF